MYVDAEHVSVSVRESVPLLGQPVSIQAAAEPHMPVRSIHVMVDV